VTVRFLHIRECDEHGEIQNTGGATIAFAVSPELDAIFVQLALCSRKDQYNKKTGRELAAKRLVDEGPLDILGYKHPISDAVRLWFMQYYDVGLIRSSNKKRYMVDWSIPFAAPIPETDFPNEMEFCY